MKNVAISRALRGERAINILLLQFLKMNHLKAPDIILHLGAPILFLMTTLNIYTINISDFSYKTKINYINFEVLFIQICNLKHVFSSIFYSF